MNQPTVVTLAQSMENVRVQVDSTRLTVSRIPEPVDRGKTTARSSRKLRESLTSAEACGVSTFETSSKRDTLQDPTVISNRLGALDDSCTDLTFPSVSALVESFTTRSPCQSSVYVPKNSAAISPTNGTADASSNSVSLVCQPRRSTAAGKYDRTKYVQFSEAPSVVQKSVNSAFSDPKHQADALKEASKVILRRELPSFLRNDSVEGFKLLKSPTRIAVGSTRPKSFCAIDPHHNSDDRCAERAIRAYRLGQIGT